MDAPAHRRSQAGRRRTSTGRPAHTSGAATPDLDPADVVIGFVTVGFALWTLAFWFALVLGVGWGLAGPVWLVSALIAALAWGRGIVGRRVDWSAASGSRAAWIVLAGIAASSIGSTWRDGRPVAALVVAALFMVTDPDVRPSGHRTPPVSFTQRLPVAGAALVMGALGVWQWHLYLVGVAVVAGWLVYGELIAPHRSPMSGADDPLGRPDGLRAGRPAALTAPVLLTGVALAAYILTTRGYTLDHGHYLNKSVHYAEQPWSFGVRDYMYGVPGVDHIPKGTILNSLETLVGFVSAITGISHVTLTYHLMAPSAGLLLPIGLAWTGRELEVRRPDLVATIGTAAMVLLADTHDAKVVLVRMAEGKLIAGMVAIPIFIGAVIRWWRRGDTSSLLLASAAAVGTYGLSSTAGIALVPAAAAAAAAGWLATRGSDAPRRVGWGALPVALVALMTGVGLMVHRTIETGLDRFPDSYAAWLTRLVGRSRNLSTDGSEAALFVLLAAVVIVVLAGRSPFQRWFFGVTVTGLVLVVYNPVLFDTVWDALGVTGLSWRAAWALPLGLAVGLAVDAMHGPDATISNGWLGAVLAVGVFAASTSPLATTEQGRPDAFIPRNLEAAEALLDVTPAEGRFLAPEEVEVMAIGLSADRYPTVVRPYFVADLLTYDDLPAEFLPIERLALYSALVAGRVGFGDLIGSASTFEPSELLDLLEIDAVCLPPRPGARLARALQDGWTRTSVHRVCDVYTRIN